MVITSRQERQDQERVAGPAGSLLYVAALRQPRLGLGLVVALDGEGGETFIARHEELRLADRLGDLEGAAIVPFAPLMIAAALVDLGQDDERHGQMVV